MWRASRIALCGLFLCSALAQAQPNVAAILQKVSQNYRAASSYEFVADVTLCEDGANKGWSSRAHLAFESPNRYRMEGAFPGMELTTRPPAKLSSSMTDLLYGVIFPSRINMSLSRLAALPTAPRATKGMSRRPPWTIS
jgi:hypothetical protein